MGERTDGPRRFSGFRYVGVGFSFGAYVAVGGYAGHLAEKHWGWGGFVVPLGIALGATLGTIDLLRMVKAVEKAEEKDRKEP